MTGVGTEDAGDDQRPKGDAGEPAELSSSSTTAELDATAEKRPTQAGHSDVAPTEAIQLWNSVSGGGGAVVPESARSAGSEKGAVPAAAKKKSGTKEGASTMKKSGSSTAAGIGGRGDHPGGEDANGNIPEVEGGAPPVFESVLIFGGIVDETVVSGVGCSGGENSVARKWRMMQSLV